MVEYEFYEFWGGRSRNDIAAINYLLGLLTTAPVDVTISYLAKITENSRLLLARTGPDDNLIGMATLAIITIPTGKFGRIEDVVIHDDYRGQGIGKALTEKLITEAKKLGLKRIDLTSHPRRVEANQLYRDLGFEPVETNLYRLRLES